MRNNFAAFILTHGRANNVITYDTLKRCGYTGKIYIIIDNEDKTANEYYEKFGDQVIMFDKLEVSKTFDQADNFEDRRAIVYARNASFDIARKLGLRYFIQLDDDYTTFSYVFDKDGDFKQREITNIDPVFEAYIDFLNNTPVKTIAFAQRGDFIGGSNCDMLKGGVRMKRKAMNSFFCDVENPFQFKGRINEDVNTYTHEGSKGDLFFTAPLISLNQKATQENAGGMTDIYLDNGTYVKSFYSVIFQPSSVSIRMMGETNRRLHHRIKWKNTVPKILNEKEKV